MTVDKYLDENVGSRVGGGTHSYEAMLEKKRMAIRRALKMQYIKTVYDPRNYDRQGRSEIFDAALARFHAMRATRHEYTNSTVRRGLLGAVILFLPLFCLFKMHSSMRRVWNRRIQNGEMPYDDDRRKARWTL